MENKGLIFIPDISGFIHFVNSVELEHSQHIIQELLEVILDANKMDLQVSEVDGDAILFYKFRESLDLDLVCERIEKMFLSFHKHLQWHNLTLKGVTHYGEFKEYKIRNFRKLIGKDIIIVNQTEVSFHFVQLGPLKEK